MDRPGHPASGATTDRVVAGSPTGDERDRLPCPRCDHDVRGEQLTWRTECPLQGRCSECGLDFAWGDLLSGRLHYPRWSTEDAQGILALPGRMGRQLGIATARPRRMVRELRLEHGIRPGRLVAGLVLPVLLLAAVLVLITAREYGREGIPWPRAVVTVLTSWPADPVNLTLPTPPPGDAWVAVPRGGRFLIVPRDPAWGTPPLITEDGPGSRAFMLPHPLIEVASADGGRVLIEPVSGARRTSPDGTEQPIWMYMQPVVTAARQLNGVAMAYPSPARVLAGKLSEFWGLLAGFVMPLALVVPVSVVGFAVLPIARRRARVRWAHLLRLTVLGAHGGLGLLVVVLVLGPLAGVLGSGRPAMVDAVVAAMGNLIGLPRVDRPLLLALLGLFGLPIGYAALWWTWAARHYLRMKRPVLVGASAAAVSWLAFVVVAGVVLFAFVGA